MPAMDAVAKGSSTSPKPPSPKADEQAANQSPPRLPETQNSIEADSIDDDNDDGYESDYRSSGSTSISSSIRDHVFENNRRYHKYKEGRYLLPNDEPEQERENMKHAMIVHVCDGQLHFAPIHEPSMILDIGTGTGIWALDMADEYPEAEVIGIDLSPVQPVWVPPNIRFYIDDAEAEWDHPPGSLDYIHGRHICMAIKDWPRLLNQAYESLKPGGWIELQELHLVAECDDNSMPSDYSFGVFLNNLRAGFGAFGIDVLGMKKNYQRLEDANFVNIHEKVWKVPIGTWPRDKRLKMIGLYNRSVIMDGLQGVAMGPYTRGLKWTPEQVEVFLVEVRRSLLMSNIHAYYTFHSVYGQKKNAL